MKRIAAGVVAVAVMAVAVMAVAGFAYARHRSDQLLQAGLAQFRAELPPSALFDYGSAEARLLSQSAVLENVAITWESAHYTAARVEVTPGDGPSIRQVTLSKVALTEPQAVGTVDRVSLDDLVLPPRATTAEMIRTTRLGHGTFDGVQFAGSEATAKSTLRRVVLDRYGPEEPGRLVIDDGDVRQAGVAGHTSFGHFSIDGLPLGRMTVPANWNDWSSYATFRAVEFKALAITGADGAVQSVGFMALRINHPSNPRSEITADVKDCVLPFPQAGSAAVQAGYKTIQLDAQLRAVKDTANRTLDIDGLDVSLAGMGHLNLAAALGNVPPDLLGPGQAGWQVVQMPMLGYLGMQIRSAVLQLDTLDLIRRLATVQAANEHVGVDVVNARGRQRVEAIAARYNLPPAVSGPVGAFIADPRHLSITLAPPQPVGVVAIAGMVQGAAGADPARTLGLTVAN